MMWVFINFPPNSVILLVLGPFSSLFGLDIGGDPLEDVSEVVSRFSWRPEDLSEAGMSDSCQSCDL